MKCKVVRLLVALWVCLLCIGAIDAAAGSRATSEYAVKAAFLFNFAKFANWPPEAFENAKSPLVLCVAGPNPFGSALDDLENKSVRGRGIEVKWVRGADALARCHVLFVSKGEEVGRLHELLAAVKGRPVLTVGEVDDFARVGGIINFVVADNKIRFEINPEEGRRAGIRVSAQLLKLATIVGSEGAEQ